MVTLAGGMAYDAFSASSLVTTNAQPEWNLFRLHGLSMVITFQLL